MRWPSLPSTHKTTTGETRSLRRFVHSFHSTGSYGLVMLMIVATYVLATTLTQQWGATIVLVAQIGTVWLALRTSLARRRLRAVAAVLFAAAIVAAAANLLVERDSDLVAFVFLTARPGTATSSLPATQARASPCSRRSWASYSS